MGEQFTATDNGIENQRLQDNFANYYMGEKNARSKQMSQ